ncbi:MAG TPA: arsenate reductase ArsC [Thermoleophilaceae bacterium]|jgi:arsenate reductase (thioredoxin)|nr:arsenate reductase ArsC [Thermoleophilaceae bacterium]
MKYVLFVCTHNAGRSQMAQALFERHSPDDIRAESAGQQPAERVWPEVVEAMGEIGIDLSDRRPKRLTVEMQLHADWAITLACGAQCPYVPTTVEDWDIPDPAGKPIEEVRAIRDVVEMRVKDLIEQRLDAIRSDRTAHQLRLQRLLPDLVQEFEGMRSDAEIRACADAILADYQEAPVRSFVMSIAHRRTRDCLRAEHCDALATADR